MTMTQREIFEHEDEMVKKVEACVREVNRYFFDNPETKEGFAKRVRWALGDLSIACLPGAK